MFGFEDWALLSLRVELHLLAHSFRKDMGNCEIRSLSISNINSSLQIPGSVHCEFSFEIPRTLATLSSLGLAVFEKCESEHFSCELLHEALCKMQDSADF